MENISKYVLFILFLGNIAAQYTPLEVFSDFVFYSSLVLGIVCLFLARLDSLFTLNRFRSSSFLWVSIAIYICYQFTFGIMDITLNSLKYLLAKITVLFLIFLGVQKNLDFYYKRIIPMFSILIAALIVYGFLFSNLIIHGRMTMGFDNPNSISATSVIGFAGFLLVPSRFKWLNILGLLICLLGVMGGGSRTSFGMCVIAIFMKYEFSFKTVIIAIACLLAVLLLFPYLGFHTIAVDRIVDVFETGNYVGSRADVRKATWMMITEHPFVGWGYKSGIQGEAALVSQMGSHNGYLDTIKAMGVLFASILFGYLVYILYKIRSLFKSRSKYIKYHLFIVLSVLSAALFESYIIGVNQIMTNVLFMSVAILEYNTHYCIDNENK